MTLAGGGYRSCRLFVAADRSAYTGAGGMAMALVDQHFVEGGQQLQHKLFLAAVAHGAEAPDLTLGGANASRDLNVEFVEKLIADLQVVDARGNLHGGDGDQPILRTLHERLQAQGFNAGY